MKRARKGQTTCKGTTTSGRRCRSKQVLENGYCPAHQDQAPRTFTERVQSWWRGIEVRYRAIGILTFVAVIGIMGFGLLSDVIGISNYVLDRLPTPTPSPEPSATPFTTPAAEDEQLIVVTEFADDSEARNLDAGQVLTEGIQDVMPEGTKMRVVAAEGVIPRNEAEARAVGDQYQATIILWGSYADNVVEVNFTPLVALDTPTEFHESYPIKQNVDELAVFVNEFASGPVRWLALLTMGQVFYLGGQYDQAVDVFDAALGLLETMAPQTGQVAATLFYRGVAHQLEGNLDAAIDDLSRAIEIQPQLVPAYSNRGNAYVSKEDYGRAIADYRQAIQRSATCLPCAYYGLGIAYWHQGEYDVAIQCYDDAIEVDPGFVSAYYGRGIAYADKGDHERAIADFDEAIRLDPDTADSYVGRAISLREKGDVDRALTDLNKAIGLESGCRSCVYYSRGRLYFTQGDYGRALADYGEAIRLDPDYGYAYHGRGVVYSTQGDYEQAIIALDRAIELESDLAAAYNSRGIVYGKMDDYERAVEDFSQAIGLQSEPSGLATNYANRCGARIKTGDYEGAIADCSQAMALGSEDDAVYRMRGVAHYEKGVVDQAISDLDQAIALNAGNAESYYSRALAHARQGNWDQVLADLNDSLALDVSNPDAYARRGTVYARQGAVEEAMADFNQAIALDPQHAMAYDNRGMVNLQQGDHEQAIADFTKAIALDPQDATAYYNRGVVYFDQGNLQQAIADFTQAIEVNSHEVLARYNRGIAYKKLGDKERARSDFEEVLALSQDPNMRGLAEERLRELEE